MNPRSLAIRSRYSHHAGDSGYRQILQYTAPLIEIGVDERAHPPASSLWRRYPWLYELTARRKLWQQPVDVIHILYAEEYYRFTKLLCPRTPLVLTFHQPPDVLERELRFGDTMGRAHRITHRLTRSRFRRADAAIVTNLNQLHPLAEVMHADSIHHIPLGAAVEKLVALSEGMNLPESPRDILTVGNWRRDWTFYFAFVEWCRNAAPDFRFVLVNRKLPAELIARAARLENLEFCEAVSDDVLYGLYHGAAVQFLPFEGVAGNNSVNEGLAFGCPIVTNARLAIANADEITTVVPLDFTAVHAGLLGFLNVDGVARAAIRDSAREAVRELDWRRIAERTIDVYRSVI
jgi:glycosyltransferase involved in cell wall biosynthesis